MDSGGAEGLKTRGRPDYEDDEQAKLRAILYCCAAIRVEVEKRL